MSDEYKEERLPPEPKKQHKKTASKAKKPPTPRAKSSPISKPKSAVRSCSSVNPNWQDQLHQSEEMKQCLEISAIITCLVKDEGLRLKLDGLKQKVQSLAILGPSQFANQIRALL